jgi:hypothetical protein
MKKQHRILIAAATAYALLLGWFLNDNQINIKPGLMPTYIGHNLQDHAKTTQILPRPAATGDTLPHHGLYRLRRRKDTTGTTSFPWYRHHITGGAIQQTGKAR